MSNIDNGDLKQDILCKPKADTVIACLNKNLAIIDLILKYISDLNEIHSYLFQKRTLTDEMYGNLAIILHGPVYGSTKTLKKQAQSILGYRSNDKQGHEYLRNYCLTVMGSGNLSSKEEKEEAKILLDFIDDKEWLSGLRKQVKIWTVISASTAIAFLLLVLFVVIYSIIYQQTWSSIVIPLLSALPTFATMLVYTRVNKAYDMAQNERKTSLNEGKSNR